jgi:hypothetical protein
VLFPFDYSNLDVTFKCAPQIKLSKFNEMHIYLKWDLFRSYATLFSRCIVFLSWQLMLRIHYSDDLKKEEDKIIYKHKGCPPNMWLSFCLISHIFYLKLQQPKVCFHNSEEHTFVWRLWGPKIWIDKPWNPNSRKTWRLKKKINLEIDYVIYLLHAFSIY